MASDPDDKSPRDLLDWLGLSANPNWAKARTLGGIAGIILSLFFIAAFVAAASVLFGTIRDVFAGHPTGPNLGAGALITALLGAPFLIWSTLIKHKSLGFQKEGHLTDRISKAVEQLGAEKTVKRKGLETTLPNIEVRIGGILSLERIAQDSTAYDKGRDHVRCMEILCAYIRENAPAKSAKDHDLPQWKPLKDNPTEAERAAHLAKRAERFGQHHSASLVWNWAQALPEPRADIALALRVIGRRNAKQRQAEARWGKDARPDAEWVFDTTCKVLPDTPEDRATTAQELEVYIAELDTWTAKIRAYKGYHLDLRKTNLQRTDLSHLILSGALMLDARIEGANLVQVRMEGANLRRARMEGANLRSARIEGADLWRAQMEGADLSLARMEGADLRSARMEGANLIGARMEVANFGQARMEGADLRTTPLDGITLSETQIAAALLTDAQRANLTRRLTKTP